MIHCKILTFFVCRAVSGGVKINFAASS